MKNKILSAVCILLVVSFAMQGEAFQPVKEDWQALEQYATNVGERINEERQRTDTMIKDLEYLAAQRKWVEAQPGFDPQKSLRNMPHIPAGADRQSLDKRLAACVQLQGNSASVAGTIKSLPDPERTQANYVRLRRMLVALRKSAIQLEEEDERIHQDDPKNIFYFLHRGSLILPTGTTETLETKTVPVGPPPKGIHLTWRNFPRIDGSTTAQPLSTLIACKILGLDAVWKWRVVTDGYEREKDQRTLFPVVGESGGNSLGLAAAVNHSETHSAYQHLIDGTSDIILVAREPSPDEAVASKQKGIDLDIRPFAHDAFVFLLNEENPVKNLSLQQIKDIYQDKILGWDQVGGTSRTIVAYQRERNSGSQEMMQSLVMKNLEIVPPDKMLIGAMMSGPYNQLRWNPNGIGYTFYYYHVYQSPSGKIRMCAINGVMPTSETIQNGSYPLVTDVYVVTRKNQAKDSSAIQLGDWLLTPEGQAVVKESGYVPVQKGENKQEKANSWE